jgi:effector-binding domain-containing protein
MKINNKWLFIGAVILLSFVGIYQYIKSQVPIDISIQEIGEMTVYGSYFEGDWQAEDLKNLFKKADSLSLKYDGTSSAVYYNDPFADDGFMKVFVGVISEIDSLPEYSEKKVINSGLKVFGKISNDYFQIPQRIYLEMEEFAKNNGHEIAEFSVEQYFSDSLMIVYIPILEK